MDIGSQRKDNKRLKLDKERGFNLKITLANVREYEIFHPQKMLAKEAIRGFVDQESMIVRYLENNF